MKPGGALLLILTTTFLFATGFRKTFKLDFALFIGSCYESDTLQIKIDGNEIIDSLIATSGPSGRANISIINSNEGLFVFWKQNKKALGRLELKKEIELEMSINGITTISKIDLRKGKIIVADHCPAQTVDRHLTQKLTLKQWKIRELKKELELEKNGATQQL